MTKTALLAPTLTDARLALEGRDIERARAILGPLTEKPAEDLDTDTWRDIAALLRDAGAIEPALACWEKALAQGLESYVGRMETATTLLAGARFDEALECLDKLYDEHPENPTIGDLFAIAQLECGRHGDAMATWDKVLAKSAQVECPLSTHPLYLSLGVAAFERYLADRESPESSTSEATEISNETAPGLTLSGRLSRIYDALHKKEDQKALRWIEAEKARSDDKLPDDITVLHAWALGENGRWMEARRMLAAYLKEHGPEPMAEGYFGLALLRSGDAETADEVLRRIDPYGPDDFMVNYYRGCALLHLERRTEALLSFQTAFGPYFFDTYHGIVLPLWRKIKTQIENPQEKEMEND